MAGLALAAVGLLVLSRLTVSTPLALLFFPFALIGFGLGLSGPARTSVILSAPPPRLIGSGAGKHFLIAASLRHKNLAYPCRRAFDPNQFRIAAHNFTV